MSEKDSAVFFALLVAALAGCGDNRPSTITVIDAHQELAFQLRSSTVRVERAFTKGVPLTVELDVVGNADAFPGPDQVPLGGDMFVSVENPAALGEGALGGELPDHERYQLSNQFLPASVSYAWYQPDTPCFPGCTRHATLSITLVDSILGGVAPDSATAQLAFSATLSGWILAEGSPRTAAPSIQLDVR